ncbi:MAG: homogentisate 1,2-dioxygenase [bacterium]|nr:MAG: homogentisate 1,2-dioxygenase [bacterium]
MSFYQKRGEIPSKKHVTFYQKDNRSLYREELVSTKGFSGICSTKYHINLPTAVRDLKGFPIMEDKIWHEAPLENYHFNTNKVKRKGNFVTARNYYLSNDHVELSCVHVSDNCTDLYENASAHELVFIHHGTGQYLSDYGVLPVQEGDYLMIPKGTIGQLQFDDLKSVKLLIIESCMPFEIPKSYRNDYGQLLEQAPYCERDFTTPKWVEPLHQKGDFTLVIKSGNRLYKYILAYHPFDLIGWDGYYYPFTFNIKDYSPIVGKLHLPPPVHMVFNSPHFVICNFVPRPFDFHPQAIPAPYYHSNIDSDEVLYYVAGDFMSRKGIEEGSITLHPGGIPHGPQPGKIEESIGKKETKEYAIMLDTFSPLKLTTHARSTMIENYYQSWLQED